MFQRFDIHSRIVMRSGIVFYGARDKLLGKDVWLWRLYEFHEASPPPAAGLLAQEKAPLRSLRHPAIVTVHDVEADPDGIVAILEPAAGEPLDEVIAGGPLAADEFVPLAEAVLAAIAHAAGAGIVHGAVEPGMIFLERKSGAEPAVKILGLGLSRLIVHLHGGQFEGGEADDLRQLGLIFHGLLTGEQAADPPAAIQEKAPAVPDKIAAWLMRFFSTDENEQHVTAAAALDQLREAAAPPPPEPAAIPQPMMQPAAWPMQHPGWMPQPAMWQPMPWPPPDPNAMQQPPMWQPPMMHPWPQPMPMMQPMAPPITEPPPAAAQPAAAQPKPSGPMAKTPASSPKPSGPLPAGPKTGPLKTDKAAAKKTAPPKASAKKWIGPSIALAATCITLWFMRGFLSPLFRSETWQGMFGNIEIRIGDGKPAAADTTTASAKASAPSASGTSTAPSTIAATQPPAPSAASAKAPAKAKAPPAKKPAAPTGPIFTRRFDDPYRKGRTPEFKPAGATITVIDAPATWPGGGKTAQVAATANYAALRASLPKDPRLVLKPGQGIRLQFNIHFTAPIPPMDRGFRFGVFGRKNIGYFCSVPAGAAGEMKLLANPGKTADLAGGKDAVEIPLAAKAPHPGLAAGTVIRCSLTIQPQADGSIQLAATAADAACTATADPKTHPIDLDFTSGILVLRNTGQLASFHFDDVVVEKVK